MSQLNSESPVTSLDSELVGIRVKIPKPKPKDNFWTIVAFSAISTYLLIV